MYSPQIPNVHALYEQSVQNLRIIGIGIKILNLKHQILDLVKVSNTSIKSSNKVSVKNQISMELSIKPKYPYIQYVIEWSGYTLLSLKQVLSVLEHKTIILLLLVNYIVYIHQSSFTIINVHTVTQITVHINQQT